MPSSKPPSRHFNLLYFASAASFTKKNSEVFEAPIRASDLFDLLEKRYPGIKDIVLSSCAVTVNLEYIDLDVDEEAHESRLVIKEGDEVAIIPPVSSG